MIYALKIPPKIPPLEALQNPSVYELQIASKRAWLSKRRPPKHPSDGQTEEALYL